MARGWGVWWVVLEINVGEGKKCRQGGNKVNIRQFFFRTEGSGSQPAREKKGREDQYPRKRDSIIEGKSAILQKPPETKGLIGESHSTTRQRGHETHATDLQGRIGEGV